MQDIIYRKPRFNVKNGTFIDCTDDVETHHVATERMFCTKCAKTRYHEIFVEVSGNEIIKIQPIAHCKDCHHETRGEIKPGGNMATNVMK